MNNIKELAKVCLIGRTNVGKSTLFNLLTEEKGAITSGVPGTTRDLKQGECVWQGKSFNIVDTAGIDVSTEAKIDQVAVKSAMDAAKGSILNVLVVDAKVGLLPQDKEYARMLKKMDAPYFLLMNKVDSAKQMKSLGEFEKLGMKNSEAISGVTGAGSADFLDKVLHIVKKKLKDYKELEEKIIDIAIVGKPNVGKSSILNRIAGEEKAIVSELAHTTRDSQNFAVRYNYLGEDVLLNFVDTAGIRKKRKISDPIEKESVRQSLYAIQKAKIVLLVIDAGEDITAQDKNITKAILEQNKSLIIVVNKWDLVEDKDTHSDKTYTEFLHKSFPYLTWAPIVFLSALTGAKIKKLITNIIEIYDKQNLEITDEEMKQYLNFIIKKQSPKKAKGTKRPYIHTFRQLATSPQTFELVTDQPENIHFSYMRYIKNQLRSRFSLEGVGIKVIPIDKKKVDQKMKNVTKGEITE